MGDASTPSQDDPAGAGSTPLALRVLRALPDPVLVCKAGGRIVLANPALHALLGYDDGALVGRKAHKVLPDDFRERAGTAPGPGQGLEGDDSGATSPVAARRRDGERVPVAVALATIPGVGRPLSVAVLRLLDEPSTPTRAADLADVDGDGQAPPSPGQGAGTPGAPAELVARSEHDEVRAERDAAIAERDAARAQLRTTTAERDAARTELRAATTQRDAARAELHTAIAERDDARAELRTATTRRDTARTELDEARRQRDQALAEDEALRLTGDAPPAGLGPGRTDDHDTAPGLGAGGSSPSAAAHDGEDALTSPDGSRPDDALGRLPERGALRAALQRALAGDGPGDPAAGDGPGGPGAGGPAGAATCGVVIVDLDRFGELRHAYGPAVADELLLAVVARLVEAVGPHDVLSRMRTAEFAVLHTSSPDRLEGFTDLARRIEGALAAPFRVGEVSLEVSASIGVAVGTATTTTPEELLREADVAVGRARSAGGGRVELFDHELRQQARRRLDQAAALTRAIEDDELLVLWQTCRELRPPSGRRPELWAEALVRWHNPERGLVSASNFILLAEETGLIVPVGRLVLEAACRQLQRWNDRPGPFPTRVSVNVSPRELAAPDLVGRVEAVLAATGVAPSALTMEVTESVLGVRAEAAEARLHELRELGVGLAMDDVGAGSFDVLRRLPLTELKIDRSFVAGLTDDPAGPAIVRGIVEAGHGLGLTVIAEGVETSAQLACLVEIGCDRGQGYLWESPVPVDVLEDRLEASATGP